jgi:hypothetical protein
MGKSVARNGMSEKPTVKEEFQINERYLSALKRGIKACGWIKWAVRIYVQPRTGAMMKEQLLACAPS